MVFFFFLVWVDTMPNTSSCGMSCWRSVVLGVLGWLSCLLLLKICCQSSLLLLELLSVERFVS